MGYFFQGLTMGLAYVAPIGLQNLFVINSALTHTRRRALLTAWIVIFFDVTLALACFFGIGAVMERYQWLQMVILCVGSLIVIYIGIGLLQAKAEEIDRSKTTDSIRKTISSACVVTWFNPQAIIDGTMMLGAFHVTLPAQQSIPFISGVGIASCLWFTGITLAISLFSDRFNAKTLRMINVVCGVIIIFYGCKLMWNFIQLL
ncbi:MAG: LysE family transporter [Flintibacter sp.]|uniref:LysE/ArgO family amino acid transporter n=1 Tax=Flintibacter sp. TaxID=1918624 RepID=UPI00267318D3|nr:LysE family transporter [Flintibacter sp.]MCI6150830.1 LysE family transporter [Flintibacter sp.]MCI7658525.1 LysE family transporter [Flintibacter sp.]MDY5037129.1 LysE family transporter [Lawsonibacter sp.]